jgi:hypothetical protein
LSFSNGSSALVHFPLVKHERRSSSAGLLLAELEGFGARWGRPLAHAGKNEEAKGNAKAKALYFTPLQSAVRRGVGCE